MIPDTRHDFGTLATESIAFEGLAELRHCVSERHRAEVLARVILAIFDDYYIRSRRIPALAKRAFETCDWPQAVALSQERIAIYALSIAKAVPVLKHAIREADASGGFWKRVEEQYRTLVQARYEEDLALAYLASIRRWVYHDAWEPISYDYRQRFGLQGLEPFLRVIWPAGRMTPQIVRTILEAPGLDAPFRDLDGDAAAVSARINAELGLDRTPGLDRIEVVTAGFYRNRGCYVLGGLEMQGRVSPLALALLNGPEGVHVDAVILRETTLRHVFSSTLANFHVAVTAYHELVDYLHGLMPSRPRGLHYSTIGYNHVGKLAVMQQIRGDLDAADAPLDHAPGPRGSVALGFTAPGTGYVLKVIRNQPTASYKWESFGGMESVLAKYRSVHELNRSGSMLDNILYQNLALPRTIFAERFLEDLLDEASGSVTLYRNEVFFRHMIVQRKLTPVPLYLERCSREEAELVVIRLGQCIRNNAAMNVFNRDLDGRNYGVSSLRFVYLFDYDAIEPLTGVKVRTNVGRDEGEEDIPDWVFEEGTIFLPEELEAHLRLPNKGLRRLFREAHGEILTAPWWERMQRWLAEGRVPKVRTYPRATQLNRDRPEENLVLRSPERN